MQKVVGSSPIIRFFEDLKQRSGGLISSGAQVLAKGPLDVRSVDAVCPADWDRLRRPFHSNVCYRGKHAGRARNWRQGHLVLQGPSQWAEGLRLFGGTRGRLPPLLCCFPA